MLFALLGSGALSASTTDPVGWVKVDLAVGFNAIGLNVHNLVTVSGTFESETGGVFTDDDYDFGANLTDTDATYLLELNTGASAGVVGEISAISGNTVTLGASVPEGDASYTIRKAMTLNEIFGTGVDAKLKGSTAPTAADIVWIPDGTGGYDQYFYNTVGEEFYDAGSIFGAPAKPVSVYYPDGMLVQIRDTPVTLWIMGEVKKTPTIFPALNGFNLVTVPSPVGQTLAESKLEDYLRASTAPTDADIVWVPNGSGGYTQYFYHSGDSVWRLASSLFSGDSGDIPIGSAILIQRRGAATTGIFSLPAYFSNF